MFHVNAPLRVCALESHVSLYTASNSWLAMGDTFNVDDFSWHVKENCDKVPAILQSIIAAIDTPVQTDEPSKKADAQAQKKSVNV
jgi:hypothetical protein